MSSTNALVGIVMVSRDEMEPMRPALKLLDRLGCPYEVLLGSIWTDPDRLIRWAAGAAAAGLRVLLAAAGTAPQLPGLLAAATRLPVIAVPLALCSFKESEALQLALATSPAAPVAAVEPGAAEAAALLAVRQLATADPRWIGPLETYRRGATEQTERDHQALQDELSRFDAAAQPPAATPQDNNGDREQGERGSRTTQTEATGIPPTSRRGDLEAAAPPEPEQAPVEIHPVNLDRPLTGRVVGAAKRKLPDESPLPPPARRLGRHRIDPDDPEYGTIEEAVDCLLEGGVVALPTDTVYGLAVDATNIRAVERLYHVKGRDRDKPLVLMVDSSKLLGAIARNLTVDVRSLMEAFWPGPLTIVFQKRPGNFMHVSPTASIGVRLPDHSTPLALVQTLARPIACTSANLSGQPEILSADEVEQVFAERINMILDGGVLATAPASTVIDVTADPYRILRAGSVSQEQLAALLGDKLELEL